jgi:hypothetical protein
VPGEGSPWRGTLLNDATIGILDPYAVWRKVPRARLATERRDRDNRPVDALSWKASISPPARQAAVRVKGAG